MPLRRYQIRNEYGLADPELYRAADKDDPEALLEGVAMAGLVGVLRQLGDLAEFAAEIFHDLHEEVMTTAARGHDLMARVQQLEAEFPTLEKALLFQTNHSSFFSNAGVVDWHPTLRSEQNLITGGDLPRFIMDSYEECRGPPRLFLLDKFDVAGAGACLKRYTDPSVFKTESSSSESAMSKIHWEKRTRKTKKKGNRRNGETPEVTPTHAKLHQLFLEEHFENNYNDAVRLVKLKKRQLNGSGVDWKSGRSYMDKFLRSPSPDNKIICLTSSSPMPLNMLDNMHEDAIKILEISTVSPVKQSLENDMCSSPNERVVMLKPSLNLDGMVVGDLGVLQPTPNDKPSQTHSTLDDVDVENKLAADRMNKREDSSNEHHYDDILSEVDNYMDALTKMESETETENDDKPRNKYLNVGKQGTYSEGNDESQAQFYDSQSIGNSSFSDEIGSFKRNISNFSYSDTLSSVVDSAPSDSDVAAKLLSSDWSCEAEVMDAQATQVHVPVLLQKPDNSVLPRYALCKGEKFPDFGEASADSCLTNTCPELLKSDAGTDTASAQSMVPQMEDMLSQCVKSHPRLSEDEEACNLRTHATALVTGDLSLAKNDLFMESSGVLPVNKLDHGCHHQDVSSNSVFKCCDVSESIPDLEHHDSSVNEESQTDIMGNSFEILADGKIASPEKHLNLSSIATLDGYSDVPPEALDSISSLVKPNDEVSKSEDGFVDTTFTSDNSTFNVDMLQAVNIGSLFLLDAPFAGKLEVEHRSALTCTTLQIEPGSKGEIQCDDLQSYDEGSHRIVNDEVNRTTTCRVDTVTDDRVFEYQLHPDQETHQSVADELSKAVDGEDVTSGVPAADCFKDVDDEAIGPISGVILSHSQNLTDMQTSPVELENSDLETLHLTDATSAEFCKEVETQKQLREPEQSSDILYPKNNHNTNSQESGLEHGYPCSRVEQNKPVPIELEGQKDMNRKESYSYISSSDLGDFAVLQESQSDLTVPQERENAAYSTEPLSQSDAEEAPHELQVVTPDIESTQDRQNTFGNSDPDIYDTLNVSSGTEITDRTGLYDFMIQDDISMLEKKDAATIPFPQSHVLQWEIAQASIEHLEPGTFLEQPLESNDELHNTELVKDFEKENLRTEQIYSSNPLHLKEYSTGESRSYPEIPDESPSKSLPNSNKLGVPKQFVYPVEPIIPSDVSLSTHINLDEVPPMPPLPPMQWLGKGQPSSLGSKVELDRGSHVAFKPSLVSRTDEKGQIDLHTFHQGILLPENLFFSAMDFKGNDLQHATGVFAGDLKQPVQNLHLPSRSSNFTGHFNYISMEGSQAHNQFQTSCSRCTEHSPMYPCLREETFQLLNSSLQELPTENRSNIETSVSLQETVTISSPLGAETSSRVHQSSAQNLIATAKHSGVISTVPPVAESMQLHEDHDRALPSDVEVLDPSLLTSLSEDGKPNDPGSTKIPRPRNPLIDAVAAHDKSKLRKVAERIRPQLAPKLDERDSMLEQIRTKSFNLKPALTTRPSIQGPRTNLKVAAILEKANAIRQALAGSDEDDDADSWSDS